MKLINKTNYDTRYLRSLLLKCEKHEGTNHKYRKVKVIYSKSMQVGGYAWYDSYSVVMKLPKRRKEKFVNYHTGEKHESEYGANIQRIAQVYIHEVGHNLGLHHKDMTSSLSIDVSWLPNEIAPIKQPKPQKPRPNIIEVRANKAQAKLDEWTKKFNRAKTFVKKYQRKVKYYEKKMAASRNEKQG